MVFRIILTFFILLSALPIEMVNAQNGVAYAPKSQMATLKGSILSSENNKPIPFALFSIEETGEGVVADEQGRFEIKLKPGENEYGVSALGFESQNNKITLDRGATQELNFTLQPQISKIAEVVVKGQSQSRSLQDKGFAMNNISMQDAITHSFTTEELLNRSAGLRLRSSGGIGSETEYNINGLSGGSVKVYIDGVPISAYGDSFSVSNIPPSMIERVEVYKGVVPAHLADDALGGAINVILKKNGMRSLAASYSYGSFNTHNFDVNGLYKNDKNGFFAGGSAFYNSSDNNYKVWGDAVYVTDPKTGRVENIVAERFHDSYKSQGINFNTGFSGRKWADDFRLNLVFNEVDKDIQTGATMQTVYGNRRSEMESYVASLGYRKQNILPRLDLRSNFAYSYSERQVIDTCNVKYDWSGEPIVNINGEIVHWATTGEAGRATLENNKENNFNNRTSLKYSFDKEGRHSLSANGSYLYFERNIDDPFLTPLEQSLTDAREVHKYTLSASYDAKLFNERLNFSAFYKYFSQDLSLSDPVFVTGQADPVAQSVTAKMDGDGYGATLSFALTDYFKLNASAEKTLRLPGITEMIGNSSENIEANPDLRPEQSENLNLGFSLEDLPSGAKGRLSANLNLFYRDVTDMIERGEISNLDEVYSYTNLGKVLSRGADIEMRYIYDERLTLSAASSYTDAKFNLQYDENGAEYLWYGDKLRNMPYFMANAGASYSLKNVIWKNTKLALNYHFNYVHEFYKNWESLGVSGKATIPTQLTHDLGLAYTFAQEKVTLSIDAKNIFDEQLFDNYALQKPGRMIFAKLAWKIF